MLCGLVLFYVAHSVSTNLVFLRWDIPVV